MQKCIKTDETNDCFCNECGNKFDRKRCQGGREINLGLPTNTKQLKEAEEIVSQKNTPKGSRPPESKGKKDFDDLFFYYIKLGKHTDTLGLLL